ncbi:unnamed protein product [Timema podura]|uniref:Uncharacterized protein n=1 Tax=Timema podura TaxID=61482 RepID=A0ABN7P3I4_TIMPD|nr:unnamed protein product [Timema podura]
MEQQNRTSKILADYSHIHQALLTISIFLTISEVVELYTLASGTPEVRFGGGMDEVTKASPSGA